LGFDLVCIGLLGLGEECSFGFELGFANGEEKERKMFRGRRENNLK